MILQSLSALYDREIAAGRNLSKFGYERKAFDLVLDLAADGRVLAQTTFGKLSERHQSNVPRWPTRSGKRTGEDIKCAFLVDKAEYVLGFDKEKAAAWAAYHRDHLAGTEDEGLRALLRFLDAPGRGLDLEGLKSNMTVGFLFNGGFLHERPVAYAIWLTIMPRANDAGLCLVSGEEAPIADLHPRVAVAGRMAALVSYNDDALEHYGHEGGGNSPISETAAHAYATGLDELIVRGHRVAIGNAVLVYWTEIEDTSAADTADGLLAAILKGTYGPDANAEAAKLRDALAELAHGKPVSRGDARGMLLHPCSRAWDRAACDPLLPAREHGRIGTERRRSPRGHAARGERRSLFDAAHRGGGAPQPRRRAKPVSFK